MGKLEIAHPFSSQQNSESKLGGSVRVLRRFAADTLASNTTPQDTSQQNPSPNNSGNDRVIRAQQGVPTSAIIIIVVVIAMFVIICSTTWLVFYLRRRKPRRMEMAEAGILNHPQSASSLPSKTTTVYSTSSQRSNPVPPIPTLNQMEYRGPTVVSTGPQVVVPRISVKREAVPASVLPSLLTKEPPSQAPALFTIPTVSMPTPVPMPSPAERSKSPTPSMQGSLARPGQVLKVMNATARDFIIAQIAESATATAAGAGAATPLQRMSYTDLPKIRTDFSIKGKSSRIPIPHLKRPASMDSTLSRANSVRSIATTRSTASVQDGHMSQNGRPLPLPPSLVPGGSGKQVKETSST